ncbi:MAG: hypothetical protein HWN65_24165 [Candidatus Helarchaeota archaeon]|nr:hypothetical protein [Candidatus Helarchaeota archaeon]
MEFEWQERLRKKYAFRIRKQLIGGIGIVISFILLGIFSLFSWNVLSYGLSAISAFCFTTLAVLKIKDIREEPIGLKLDITDQKVVLFVAILFIGYILIKIIIFIGWLISTFFGQV